jgi:putative peptidoglycan lipid II flippase
MFRSILTVTSNTLISRVLGFIRDILIARLLGSGPLADAWIAAFRFPNLFRRMFAEGAFNSAFVPIYAKIRQQQGDEVALTFANNILTIMFSFLVVLVLVVQLTMPWLIYIFAPGFSGDLMGYVQQWGNSLWQFLQTGLWQIPIMQGGADSDKLDLAVKLTIICMPYAAFMFVVALCSGILNCHKRFLESGLVSSLLNVCLTASMFFHYLVAIQPVYLLAWGCFIAGVFQVAFMVRGVYDLGYRLKFIKPQITDQFRQFFKLLIPGLIAGGVTQINVMIGSIIASFQSGAMSYLYYTDRIYQLPLGSIGVAIGIVLLPQLVTHIHEGHHHLVNYLQNRAVEFALLITIPASVALAVIPYEIVSTLFQHGSFTAFDSVQTAHSLMVYSVGLIGFILLKVFSPAYFARENTKTPMRFAGISVLVDIGVSLLLFPLWGHVGIAIATITAAWVNVAQLIYGLYRRGEYSPDHQLFNKLWRIFCAAGVMGGCLYGGRIFFHQESLERVLPQWVSLGLLCVGGGIVYFMALFALKALTIKELKGYLAR